MADGITELVDNVYRLTLKRPEEGPSFLDTHYRTYLVDQQGDVPTLFDAGHERYVDTLLDRLDTLGIEPGRVVISHHHADHTGGIDALVDRFDVELWVPARDDFSSVESFDPTSDRHHEFGGGEAIGGFEAVHIGGHTPGSSVFVDEAAGIAALGDAVSGADRRGLPAGYLIHPPQSTNSYRPPQAVVDAERNLARLVGYAFEVGLVYHGSSVLEGASEKLERYVDFEPNLIDPDARSLHHPDRQTTGL